MDGPGDVNSWSSRFGMNFNFNLGEAKAWTIGVKPALVYDMQGDYNRSRFNVNNAAFELTAGVSLPLWCSTEASTLALLNSMNPAEISDLNNSINNLRSQVKEKNGQINVDAQKISALQQEVNNLQNRVVLLKQ